jgi:hypothetical protein
MLMEWIVINIKIKGFIFGKNPIQISAQRSAVLRLLWLSSIPPDTAETAFQIRQLPH